MHRSWQIDDIWRLIHNFLDRRDFVRLARTCKAFSNIIINELWHTITSVSAFVCCLPLDFDKRPLQPQDLQRLDFYGAKIRNIHLEADVQKPMLIPSKFKTTRRNKNLGIRKHIPSKSWAYLWEEIGSVRPASGFLPNLRHLRINHVNGQVLLPLLGITGSNLTWIYIKYVNLIGESNIVAQFLEKLAETPKLKYIMVRDGHDIMPEKLIVNSTLKHLRLDPRINLYRRYFKQLPLRNWIFRAETLENLTVALTHDWYTPAIAGVGKSLPNLKSLRLNLIFLEEMDRKHSPVRFLETLDNPELQLLNIKFDENVTGRMFKEVIEAANRNCRLKGLTELALAGGGWSCYCQWDEEIPTPALRPEEMRQALQDILPLPNLKILRLSVAPNFLDLLNLEMYQSITKGLPSLEKLTLGHQEFVQWHQYVNLPVNYLEKVPLHHLAAFCSMLPKLSEVSIGTVDCSVLEINSRPGWVSPGVKSLTVHHWAGKENNSTEHLLLLGLTTYFPNSDLTREKVGAGLESAIS